MEWTSTLTDGDCLRRHWRGFGTTVELRLWPRPAMAAAGAVRLAQAAAFLRRAERRFSRFRPESELSRLNRQAGAQQRVSPLLIRLIAAALAAARRTDGRFDPTVLPALLAAGYTTTFAQLDATIDDGSAGPALRGRYRDVYIDIRRRTVLLPSGTSIDLGGIAKGWLADVVIVRLRPFGAVVVDIGGDCAFTPPGTGAPPWAIDVADPWNPSASVAELTVDGGGGVATSGILRRRWQTRSGWRHHLIDPRSGAPATTDLASVTVIGPSAAAAEVMAKVVMLEGRDRGAAALEQDRRFRGVLVPLTGPPVTVRLARPRESAAMEAVS